MKTEEEKDLGKATRADEASPASPELAQAQSDYDALAQKVAEIRARAGEAAQQAELAPNDTTRSTFEATAKFLNMQADALAGSLAEAQARLDALKGAAVAAVPVEPEATVVSKVVAETVTPVEPLREAPAPAVPQPVPASAARRTHTVVPGDSLSAISMRYFNTFNRWEEIYSLNRAQIGNDPNLIRVGQILTLPD